MRVCLNCGSTTTYYHKKDNYFVWHKYKDGWICEKCYGKLIRGPKFNAAHNTEKNPRQLYFKPLGRQILLKERVLKGICFLCFRKGYTHTHHFAEYHLDDPLKDTIEVCPACHRKVRN